MNENSSETDIKHLVADIVTAYVAHNSVRSSDLPDLIATVHQALIGLGEPVAEPAPEPLVKPVTVKKSIMPDYLISMEDGRQYKSLKRHLAGRGLTPAEYRAKWDLPNDYPMVAESYAKRRSELAISFGLGRLRSKSVQAEAVPDAPAPKRGRKKEEPVAA